MTLETPAAKPSAQPGQIIICTQCRTAQDLVIESVHALDAAPQALFSVEYSCGECESFYAHEVSATGLDHFRAELRIAA